MDPLPVINKDSDSELSCQQIEVEMDICDRKARASATRAEQNTPRNVGFLGSAVLFPPLWFLTLSGVLDFTDIDETERDAYRARFEVLLSLKRSKSCPPLVGPPHGPGKDPLKIEERAQRRNLSEVTRDEIIAQIGKPLISDEWYRVDVFRVSSTQYAIASLLPFPPPLPAVVADFRGHLLVSYAQNSRVVAADWSVEPTRNRNTPGREEIKVTARAGDFVLEHPHLVGGVTNLALGVTHARFLRELRTDTHSSASCTLLTVCGVFLPNLGWSVNRDVCFNRLHLDNRDVGEAVVANQYSMPIRVAPGTHHLSFTSEDFTGAAETTLNCAAGEVWYAKFRSEMTQKYSSIESLSRGWKIGEVAAQVTLTREPSAGDVPAAVLLYYDGKAAYRGEIDPR